MASPEQRLFLGKFVPLKRKTKKRLRTNFVLH
nr:hypothetical protein [Sicyoidochytrium minutum DNA virus]